MQKNIFHLNVCITFFFLTPCTATRAKGVFKFLFHIMVPKVDLERKFNSFKFLKVIFKNFCRAVRGKEYGWIFLVDTGGIEKYMMKSWVLHTSQRGGGVFSKRYERVNREFLVHKRVKMTSLRWVTSLNVLR